MNKPRDITASDTPFLHATKKARDYILRCQLSDGGIPWYRTGKLDPWDHAEAIMALSISGEYQASLKGFEWLANHQHANGSWLATYYSDDAGLTIETNFVAYPATALWHYYLCSQDKKGLSRYYAVIKQAVDYVVEQQNQEGDIQWALALNDGVEKPPRDALVTACASILRSLECAINIAETLNQPCEHWRSGYFLLYDALKNKPWRFDRTWESKERFSMDWFYPILAGIYNEKEARLRLDLNWNKFIEAGVGCRCVSDEPWMTVAETCELCLALIFAERSDDATVLLQNLLKWQDTDGGFWTGYNFRDGNIWPREKTTWTAAVFIMACDALEKKSPASRLFTQTSSLI